jgi:hypothetical protein
MDYENVKEMLDDLLFINKIFPHRSQLIRLQPGNQKAKMPKKPIFKNNILKIKNNRLTYERTNKNRVLRRSHSYPSKINKIK